MKYIAFFLAFICLNTSLHAERLKFKCGDSAKCRIYEKTEMETVLFGLKEENQSELTIEIGMKILGVDENDHPILVEFTPLKIDFTLVEKEGGKVTYKKYNSMNSFFAVSEFEPFQNLLNQPLVFLVKNEQSTVEATGVLEKFENDIDFIFLFDFEEIATRLLHLSGKELSIGHTINSDSEDDSVYTINTEGSGLIEAVWHGGFDESDENELCKCSVEGNVVWDLNNPLIQKREIHSEAFAKGAYSFLRMSQHQTWEPIE